MTEPAGIGLTRARDLVAVGVVAAVLSYLLVRFNYARMPGLPRFAGLGAAVLGIGEGVYGYLLRQRLRRWADRPRDGGAGSPVSGGSGADRIEPVPALTAARALMAAKATALAGAALAGLWLGLLLYVLPNWSVVAAAQSDGVTGLIGIAGSAVMIAGALFLERCCRTPGGA